MSGRRKFSELTEHFTPKDRKIVEEKRRKCVPRCSGQINPVNCPKRPHKRKLEDRTRQDADRAFTARDLDILRNAARGNHPYLVIL